MFLFHVPLLTYWETMKWFLSALIPGLPFQWEVAPWEVASWEFPIYVAFVAWFSWYATTYWSEKFTAWFQKIFNCSYCCCCCLCSGVGILCCKPEETCAEQSTMHVVLDSISNLTGADADATSKLDEIGLGSFGAGALVGLLVSRIPGLVLRAVDVYSMETVGDLILFIEKGLAETKGLDV